MSIKQAAELVIEAMDFKGEVRVSLLPGSAKSNDIIDRIMTMLSNILSLQKQFSRNIIYCVF